MGHQPHKAPWQIFDCKWEQELSVMGVGLGRYLTATPLVLEKMRTQAIWADALDELARKIDVPVGTFKATVERYNSLANIGKDLDYAKLPSRLTAIDKLPSLGGHTSRNSWL